MTATATVVLNRCECSGSRAHHAVGDSCWCERCLQLDEDARCVSFRAAVAGPKTPPPVQRRITRTGAGHSLTAQQAGEAALYRSGTLRREMYDALSVRGLHGFTDDELEQHFQKSHQTISSARNTLSSDGHIADSGERRPTRTGNEATVWVLTKLLAPAPAPEASEVSDAVQDALFGGEVEEEAPPVVPVISPAVKRVAGILAKRYGGVWSAHVSQAEMIAIALKSYEP